MNSLTTRPTKRRRLNQKTIPLSKFATLILSVSDFPREICRRIGQFCGTDTTFLRGDTIIIKKKWSAKYMGEMPFQVLANHHARGRIRWYDIDIFTEFIVKKVTPCMVVCVQRKNFYYLRGDDPFTMSALFYSITSEDGFEYYSNRRFILPKSAAKELRSACRRIGKMQKVEAQCDGDLMQEVRFDCETRELVIIGE